MQLFLFQHMSMVTPHLGHLTNQLQYLWKTLGNDAEHCMQVQTQMR